MLRKRLESTTPKPSALAIELYRSKAGAEKESSLSRCKIVYYINIIYHCPSVIDVLSEKQIASTGHTSQLYQQRGCREDAEGLKLATP